jgi:glucose-1-phosphate cytidylyltransferase
VPAVSYHFLQSDDAGYVSDIKTARDLDLRINGGGFVFNQEIFDALLPGEDLVGEALPRLVKQRRVAAYRHDGFWAAMDTFKDKQVLDDMLAVGHAPWQIWDPRRSGEL